MLMALLPAFLPGAAMSHDVTPGGRVVSTPQQLNRNSQQVPHSHLPGSQHSHVYQRQDYGKNLRRGHSVNGPYGNITIWSARPLEAYQDPPRKRPGRDRSHQIVPPTGPQLQYSADYGKPPKKD